MKSTEKDRMILAIDQSLNETGYWINNNINGLIKPDNKLSTIEKISDIKKILHNLVFVKPLPWIPQDIVIEDYSYGSKGRFTFTAGELGGMIKMFCFEHNIKLIIIPPTILKKYVCGKGNAKKEQMLLQCYKKFNKEFHNNNLCDAYCLWRFYDDYLKWKKGKEFVKYEIECFEKVETIINNY